MFSLSNDTNATIINIQSWFIPFDIFKVTCVILVIILAAIFLFIAAVDKTCHTVPMMLVANSGLIILIFSINLLGMGVSILENDLKQIQYQDSLCIFRNYVVLVTYSLQNYSYLLQAIYRYVVVVYPVCLTYQSAKLQILLICLTWICGIIFPIPIVFTHQIEFYVDNQTCEVPLRLSFLTLFIICYIYMIPIAAIVFIYFKMVRHIKRMSKRVTPANTLSRAQRELKMIGRIIRLISILLTLGIPYTIFMFMAFFNSEPKYCYRIAYIFLDVSLLFVMIALFQNTDPVKTSLKQKMNWRPNVIGTTVT